MSAKRQLIKRQIGNQGKISYERLYDEFILSKKGKIASATINYYYWNLKSLRDYMEDNGLSYINEMVQEEYNNYLENLLNKYTNPTTINTYLRATRALLYYAMREGYVCKYEIQLVNEPEKPIEVYTEKELEKLFKVPTNLKKSTFTEYRNWILVQYLSETGNRRNSVISLKVNDVDFEQRYVKVRVTKNNKVVYSPISQTMTRMLYNYIITWGLYDNDYLFPDTERKQLTQNAISKTIARYNKSRGVNKTSIHLFRHTMATNFIKDNGDISALQRLLSHSSITMTNRYVNFCNEDLIEEIDKHSLVEKIRKPKLSRRDKV